MRGIATQAWIHRIVPWASTELLIADLSLLAETRALGDLIAARHSKISVLINNAGVFESRPIKTAEGIDNVLATNLLCPFVLTQKAAALAGRGCALADREHWLIEVRPRANRSG